MLEEDPTTGQRIETCNAFLTFVALKSLRKQGNASPKASELCPHLSAARRKTSDCLSVSSCGVDAAHSSSLAWWQRAKIRRHS